MGPHCGTWDLHCDMWIFSCDVWDLVPWPRIKSGPLHWEWGVLATGLPGKSLYYFSCVISFNPPDAALGRYNYSPHFIDGETKAQLVKVIYWVRGGARVQVQGAWLQSLPSDPMSTASDQKFKWLLCLLACCSVTQLVTCRGSQAQVTLYCATGKGFLRVPADPPA